MKLLTREKLVRLTNGVAESLDTTIDVILVGGGAVLALCPDGTATKDIDAMRTEGIDAFIDAVNRWCGTHGEEPVDVNTRADPFEVFFPEDWRENIQLSKELSTPVLRIYVPRPEDLAVAKVFRFVAKDAEDIKRLASLPEFENTRFMDGFMNVLPVAIGNPREHALSFVLAWNRLYPDEPMELEDVLERAGITS